MSATLDRLSYYASVVMGVGICLLILVVVALWFAVEAAQGFGGVRKKRATAVSCCALHPLVVVAAPA